ncbi:MAG: flagellar biosynthesis protein FliQ, partial [Syntrophobacteraceae bacterium]|nr:flagellar biosynthesis protein FliQ [Syntrophobacteraceae bacterium]
IGAGRVYHQGARLVKEAIETGRLFEGRGWRRIIDYCRGHEGTLHFLGLLSDGNVHSHIDHLTAMLNHAARQDGIARARIHILLDGRDVGETSALEYVLPFEDFLSNLNTDAGVDYRIASGGGRMAITMDRYEANWAMVAQGWRTHVAGEGRGFPSARQAIETLLLVSLPALLLSLVVGLLISLFQAVTQIQEMTISFVPKIVVTFLSLLIFGAWMIGKLVDFTREMIQMIPHWIQ